MQEIRRKYVVPGDRIIDGNFRPLFNVIKAGNSIIATRVGIAEAGREGVKVIPLSGIYIPRVNDVVIGKITDHSSLSWEVDIIPAFLLTFLRKTYSVGIFHRPGMTWAAN